MDDIQKLLPELSVARKEVDEEELLSKKSSGCGSTTKKAAGNRLNEMTVLWACLFALLGGLILNLMPCVLPVLSIKILGLISHSKDKKNSLMFGRYRMKNKQSNGKRSKLVNFIRMLNAKHIPPAK